jgi:Phosphotransferase enzyme family
VTVAQETLDAVAASVADSLDLDSRAAFVATVSARLADAGVRYALLHEGLTDSDVDVVIDRAGLRVVDDLARSGVFGRLVQRFDYDVPWFRYYVFKTAVPGRRYRQLDVACDPWGIGKYGRCVSLSLATSVDAGGTHVASAAARVAYLATKRAVKGIRAGEDVALAAAYREDPAASRELLVETYDSAGGSLSDALERGIDPAHSLEAIRSRLYRRRLSPSVLPFWMGFTALRVVRRVARPTGMAVCVVGPDGAGKSTVTNALLVEARGLFRRTVRLRQRPGFLPPPGRVLARDARDVTRPHEAAPSGVSGSLARLLYLWFDSLLGWLPRVAVPRVRSSLLVFERGWLDLVVDPRRYRLSSPSAVAYGLSRFLPKPDIILLLEADADEARERKAELAPAEIARQTKAWRTLASREPGRFRRVDASRPAAAVAEQALASIEDLSADRYGSADEAFALRCLGRPSIIGERYRLIRVAGRTRWILPAGADPRGSALYRPARRRDVPRAVALGVGCRALGRFPAGGAVLDVDGGCGQAIASALGVSRVRLAAAVRGGHGRPVGCTLSVRDSTGLVAIGKAAESADPLRREAAVLELLAEVPLRHLAVPRVLGLVDVPGASVLLLQPVATPGRANRAFGATELEALTELASLSAALEPVIGASDGRVLVHGDFAPWNSAVSNDRLIVWDWEDVRAGLPLEDLFHWRTQQIVLFGQGSAETLVRSALEPDRAVKALLAESGENAPDLLRAYLMRTLADLGLDTGNAFGVRATALELLEAHA